MSAVAYPKTTAELAVGIKPTPLDVLKQAAGLAAGLDEHEVWAEMFMAVAADADADFVYAPVPGSRGLDFVWVHYSYSGACGPIDQCACALGAVLKAALEFVVEYTLPEPIQGSWTSGDGRVFDLALPHADRHRKVWRCTNLHDGVPYMSSDTAGGPLPWVDETFGPLVPAESENSGSLTPKTCSADVAPQMNRPRRAPR